MHGSILTASTVHSNVGQAVVGSLGNCISPLDLIILEGGNYMLFAPNNYVFSWQCYYAQYN